MENLDPLLTIAEVSVAFAGFASLVTVVANRDLATWNEGNLLRFRLMIYMSLASIFFALLPFVFFYFEFAQQKVWQYSGGFLALFLGTYLAYTTPTFFRVVRAGELNGYVAFTSTTIGFAVVLIQVLATLDIIAPSIGTYFLGALFFLFLSALSFVRLVGASIPKAEGDAS